MILHFTIAPKLATQKWKFQFWVRPPNHVSFDRARKTEQLLWRHHMVIYYDMRDIVVWMSPIYENEINFQKFITFRKLNKFEKSLRNIAVEGQYFIFVS